MPLTFPKHFQLASIAFALNAQQAVQSIEYFWFVVKEVIVANVFDGMGFAERLVDCGF